MSITMTVQCYILLFIGVSAGRKMRAIEVGSMADRMTMDEIQVFVVLCHSYRFDKRSISC